MRNFVLLGKIPVSTIKLFNDAFERSLTYPCSKILLESRVDLRIKHSYEEQARAYRKSCETITP